MRSRLLPGRPAKSFPHLPPGREPGIQTLRNQVSLPLWEWLTGIVGAGLAIGGIFVAAGGRGPEFDRMEEFWGGLIFVSLGLFCAGWAYCSDANGDPSASRNGCEESASPSTATRRGAARISP